MKLNTKHLFSNPDREYRPDIDGLRAIAVTMVVAYHAFPVWAKGGFIGVDIFFVISGFLVTGILFKKLIAKNLKLADFYGRRIRRIFPALIVVLFSCAIFGWFSLLPEEYVSLGRQMSGSALFLANFVLWKDTGYFDSISTTKPLLHLWSLGIEEQYYVFWPIILIVATNKFKAPVITTLLLLITSFLFDLLATSQDENAAFYLPHTRFWELMIGSGLAIVVIKYGVHQIGVLFSNLCSMLGAALIIIGFKSINKDTLYPGWWTLLPTLGTTLIIFAGPVALVNRILLSNLPMVWIGLISYPIYLWHWPLLAFAFIIESETPTREIRLIAVVLTVILSWLTYSIIEKPVQQKNNTYQTNRHLIGLMVVIFTLGSAIIFRKGFESRDIVEKSILYQANRIQLTHPESIDKKCLEYIGNDKPLFNYCRFVGNNYPKTIAIFGDSHAHAAFSGFLEIMKNSNTNVVLLGNTSCPPFSGVEKGMTDLEKIKYCKPKIEQLFELLVSKKDIEKIFYFSRGPIYFAGKPFGELQNILKSPPPIPTNVFFSSLQNSIDILHESGKKIYYVSENPELEFSPVRCIPRPLRLTDKNCVLQKKRVLERQDTYLRELSKLRNAQVINTIDTFCPDDTCLILKDGTLLYSDFDHLSIAGSKIQAAEIISKYIE